MSEPTKVREELVRDVANALDQLFRQRHKPEDVECELRHFAAAVAESVRGEHMADAMDEAVREADEEIDAASDFDGWLKVASPGRVGRGIKSRLEARAAEYRKEPK